MPVGESRTDQFAVPLVEDRHDVIHRGLDIRSRNALVVERHDAGGHIVHERLERTLVQMLNEGDDHQPLGVAVPLNRGADDDLAHGEGGIRLGRIVLDALDVDAAEGEVRGEFVNRRGAEGAGVVDGRVHVGIVAGRGACVKRQANISATLRE